MRMKIDDHGVSILECRTPGKMAKSLLDLIIESALGVAIFPKEGRFLTDALACIGPAAR
jgi:hypothetical protein